jgi:hypothetical protein
LLKFADNWGDRNQMVIINEKMIPFQGNDQISVDQHKTGLACGVIGDCFKFWQAR